jgi:methionine synthase II (cobalamin-independent)
MKFRADHVGALLVPAKLLQARQQLASGGLNRAMYESMAEEAATVAVAMQIDLRMDIVTSGALRSRASGEYVRKDEVPFLFEHTRKPYTWPFKICLPTPSALALDALLDGSAKAADMVAVAQAALPALSASVSALIAEQAPCVQLDSGAVYDWLAQPGAHARLDGSGHTPASLFDALRAIDTALFAQQPAARETSLALRLGRGGDGALWIMKAESAGRIEQLFDGMEIDRLVLDLGNQVTDFSMLSKLPAHLTVVLGLVDANSATLESTDQILEMLDEADLVIGLDRLALSTDKDFTSTTEEMQRRKLDLVQGCVRRFWGMEF